MLLTNGEMIKNDVIEAFEFAVNDPSNRFKCGGINWNFVDADLSMDLGNIYSSDYLNQCLEVLVDNYFA